MWQNSNPAKIALTLRRLVIEDKSVEDALRIEDRNIERWWRLRGLNAVTRAIVRKSEQFGYEVIGIRHGWAGLIEPDTIPLKWSDVSNISRRRNNPAYNENQPFHEKGWT